MRLITTRDLIRGQALIDIADHIISDKIFSPTSNEAIGIVSAYLHKGYNGNMIANYLYDIFDFNVTCAPSQAFELFANDDGKGLWTTAGTDGRSSITNRTISSFFGRQGY